VIDLMEEKFPWIHLEIWFDELQTCMSPNDNDLPCSLLILGVFA
jgi:hypothetical protein